MTVAVAIQFAKSRSRLTFRLGWLVHATHQNDDELKAHFSSTPVISQLTISAISIREAMMSAMSVLYSESLHLNEISVGKY